MSLYDSELLHVGVYRNVIVAFAATKSVHRLRQSLHQLLVQYYWLSFNYANLCVFLTICNSILQIIFQRIYMCFLFNY